MGIVKDGDLVIGIMASLGFPDFTADELLRLARPFAVSSSSLRTALSRHKKKGVLDTRSRNGRAAYAFAVKGRAITANVAAGFQPPDWSGWGGSYWGVVYSLTVRDAADRYRLTRKLALYRFAPLYPGFWIRPCRERERLENALAPLQADPRLRTIRFRPDRPLTRAEAAGLWDIAGAAEAMTDAIGLARAGLARARRLSPEEAFVEKLVTGERMVAALFRDPLLPGVFLPKGWPAPTLRRLFNLCDAALTAASRPYWEAIMHKAPPKGVMNENRRSRSRT